MPILLQVPFIVFDDCLQRAGTIVCLLREIWSRVWKEVVAMASCSCNCDWCKEAKVNGYSNHRCSQIPKCPQTR